MFYLEKTQVKLNMKPVKLINIHPREAPFKPYLTINNGIKITLATKEIKFTWNNLKNLSLINQLMYPML